jgi:small-conductance mechanosensitive channel
MFYPLVVTMFGQLTAWSITSILIRQVAWILGFYLLAWLVHRLARSLAGRVVQLHRFKPRTHQLRPERQTTLQGLIASMISFIAFATATFASLSLFIPPNTLIWIVGLFSAAFGLGARPVISDFLTGASLIFEDTFAVGEKVEVAGVEGVVEEVNLRTSAIRASSGELYVVPNGEVRVVRNFSRGRFSSVEIRLKIAASDLNRALPLLEELGQEAVVLLPNLLEPWQVISDSGVIGQHTELTLLTKARFGKAAEMRPRLLALAQERLTEADIALVS